MRGTDETTRRLPLGAALLCGVLLLAGCVSPEEQRAQDMASDQQNCAGLGFTPGSAAMAKCMSTAAASRAADKDRDAYNQAQRDRLQAEEDAAERARDDAQAQKNRDDFDREFQQLQQQAAQVGRPSGDMGDDGFNRPTAAAIPGMVCTGTGMDASCDAR